MPYYAWQGITLYGQLQRGKLYAESPQELDALLFKRDIALLKCREISFTFFQPSIKKYQIIQFLRTTSTLLHAGLLLPEILVIATEQTENPRLQGIISTLATDVHKGSALNQAMSRYPKIFDQLLLSMAHVGQETGSLNTAFAAVADHMEMMENFRKQIRSAALMPCVTLGFFLLMAMIIFIGIIPQFLHIFNAAHQELPMITQLAIKISNGFTYWNIVYALSLLSMLFFFMSRIFSQSSYRTRLDACLLQIPFVGVLTKQSSMIYFLRSLSLSLQEGTQLVDALQLAQASIKNNVLRQQCSQLVEHVRAGSSLSQSLVHNPSIFDVELIALVRVGEESGKLSMMLSKAADLYQAKVARSLQLCTTLFQPLCMVILGLLVMGLIFAVYVPIFNLARIYG